MIIYVLGMEEVVVNYIGRNRKYYFVDSVKRFLDFLIYYGGELIFSIIII